MPRRPGRRLHVNRILWEDNAVFVIVRWGNVNCAGPTPVVTFTLVALLFTAGLDIGLVMSLLTELPTYVSDKAYAFTNPLALELACGGRWCGSCISCPPSIS